MISQKTSLYAIGIGLLTGMIYSYLFLFYSSQISYFYLLLYLPSALIASLIGMLTGMIESSMLVVVIVAPIVGAIEGYFLILALNKLLEWKVVSNRVVYLILICLLLFNIIPVVQAVC